MMPLKKERWASIRSVKLYHEGEGINRFSCKAPTIPRSHLWTNSFLWESRTHGSIWSQLRYKRAVDYRSRLRQVEA